MAEKAKIKVLEGDNQDEIEVMFNPDNYSVTTKVEATGEGSSTQFKQVNMPEFSVTLFFDTYEKKLDVRDITGSIVALASPSTEGEETRRPPLCLFVWGGFSYKGYVSQVKQDFKMFLESGIPVRSELSVTFKSVPSEEEAERDSGREACRKLWTVKSGDRLDLIANSELKAPGQWRKIARANNITDPLAFPTSDDIGRTLIIPD